MKNDDQLLKESFKYIENNINVLSDNIPIELIEFWTVEDIENINLESIEGAPEFTVFMYALTVQKVKKEVTEFTIAPGDLIEMYKLWQISLALTMMNHYKMCDFEPFKMFDFDNLKNLEFVQKNFKR